MNRKLVKEFLLITFTIAAVFWGGCAAISQTFDLTVNHPLLRGMHVVGGFSPTIASYIALKRNRRVNGFGDWLKQNFDVRHSAGTYLQVALFVLIYYALGCLINGFELGAPVFLILAIAPMMLVGGGNEEAGWRMILQPELEKEFGFHRATLAVGFVWWIWHLPMFFIEALRTTA